MWWIRGVVPVGEGWCEDGGERSSRIGGWEDGEGWGWGFVVRSAF